MCYLEYQPRVELNLFYYIRSSDLFVKMWYNKWLTILIQFFNVSYEMFICYGSSTMFRDVWYNVDVGEQIIYRRRLSFNPSYKQVTELFIESSKEVNESKAR